jgi:hypothetical protein
MLMQIVMSMIVKTMSMFEISIDIDRCLFTRFAVGMRMIVMGHRMTVTMGMEMYGILENRFDRSFSSEREILTEL